MEVPEWLTRELLEAALSGGGAGSRVVVWRFRALPATAAGDNYTSCLLRVRAEYAEDDDKGSSRTVSEDNVRESTRAVPEDNVRESSRTVPEDNNIQKPTKTVPEDNPQKSTWTISENNNIQKSTKTVPEDNPQKSTRTVSLIIKVPFCKGMFKELSDKFDFFGAEPLLYDRLLPMMSEKMECDFYAKSFPCSIKNGLILEDLQPEGYVLRDRFVWLDRLHCEMVVESLARFHAGSVACHRDDPELVRRIGREKFFVGERMKSWAEESFRECAKTLVEIGADKRFSDLLTSKANGIWESVLNLCRSKEDSLNVLNHGDVWINNLLFKYSDEGNLVGLKFVDFQLTRYGSPVLDLIFFTWTSANEEVRENIEELYKLYLQVLNETLAALGCEERMTYETLQRGLKRHSDWALIVVCFINNFIMRDSEEFIDVSSLTKEQQKNISSDPRFPKVFRNKYYRPLLPGIARQLTAWLNL